MSDVVRWLEAGGLVPPDTAVPADVPVDTVDARGYRHPALPDRVIVRLVPDVVSRGIDTEMGLMGFALTDHADDIALRRRQALGFPGRALLEDPERARYALDVMKEFKAQAKRIASKPGHARDGFDAIAKELSGAVPHFLPSFWEEVGRAFANAGNLSYAATAFDRARTAEREFGLTVDEEVRGEAFLEFALLGGLTVKSLQAYGKELQRTSGADKAYERMFSLATRRTLGGLPPWASMIKDLRTLAKLAKRDLEAEEQRLLRELLQSSALVRAPKSFWTETRATLLALCHEDPAIRGRLLELFPNGGATRYSWSDEDGFTAVWLEFLAEARALDGLFEGGAPAAAVPTAGRAAWFVRLQEWVPRGDAWILQLVRRSAAALIADAKPLVLQSSYHRPLDLDLLELVLELEVPWALDEGYLRVDLVAWAAWDSAPARAGFPAEPRLRDPVRAAARPEVAKVLGPAINEAFGDEHFERVAARLSGLRALRRAWLEDRVADLTVSGLASTNNAVERLEQATRASHFAEFPEVLTALDQADVARALHRTLATGIIDELGWPAFDEAVRILGLGRNDDPYVCIQWPHLILATKRKAVVIGPAGVELVHDLKLGKDEEPQLAIWVDGDLLVASSRWAQGKYTTTGYWTSSPKDTFDLGNHSRIKNSSPLELPGAILLGRSRVTRGDRSIEFDVLEQLHDRDRSWVFHDQAWREQDRATGAPGALGVPGFLADVVGRTSHVSYGVVPAPYDTSSPMGTLDGLFGFKVVPPAGHAGELDLEYIDDEDGTQALQTTLVSLAGARYVGPVRCGVGESYPEAFIRFPGDDRYRPVCTERYRWRAQHDAQFTIGDPDLPCVSFAKDEFRMAQGFVPPVRFWHFLTPRDEAGSKVLRSVPSALATQLIEAVTDEADVEAEVARLLPGVVDPVLRKGIATSVKLAADLHKRVIALRGSRANGVVDAIPEVDILDTELTEALSNLGHYWSYRSSLCVTAEIRAIGRFIAGEEPAEVPESRIHPRQWVGRIRALAWCVTRPGLSDEQRRALATTLGIWRDSPLADPGHVRIGKLRVDTLQPWIQTETDEEGLVGPKDSFFCSGEGWRRWVFDCDTSDEGPWDMKFLEWSADGRWSMPVGAVSVDARVAEITDDRAWLTGLLDELERRGPRSVEPAAVAHLCGAVGLAPAEGVLALSIFPKDLTKEERATHGLKVAEVRGAQSSTHGWGVDTKLDLLAAAAPRDPAALWSDEVDDPDSGLSRFTSTWLDKVGAVVAVPSELLLAADKELPGRGSVDLRNLAAPKQWVNLHHDGTWALDDDGDFVRVVDGEHEVFTGGDALTLCHLLPWAASRLPVGDPLRAQIPTVLALARARIASPTLWIDLGSWYLEDEQSRARKAAQAWFDAVGGELREVLDDDGDVRGRSRATDTMLAQLSSWRLEAHVRPAGLDPHLRSVADAFASAGGGGDVLRAIDLLRSDDATALASRVTNTPVPAGGWEQDARISAPQTLAALQTALDLDENAALLYLQTLALLDPTKKNVVTWNGWSPAAYDKAAAVLAKRELVIEGKRARAGREHFLPGAWSDQKSILPFEEWKRELYGWEGEGFPFGLPVCMAPIHAVFERAWARHVAGDEPRFREVRR